MKELLNFLFLGILIYFLTFQVTVWGDYGRIEGKKVFMGVAQIMLDDLNLSNIVIGWYKLFGSTALVSESSSFGLSCPSSTASLDSLSYNLNPSSPTDFKVLESELKEY